MEQLRGCWRKTFSSDPPATFSKDLMARAICHQLQEEAFGGLSASTARLLRSLVKPGVEPPRQVKVGSVIVREHQGVVHEVLVVPGGFCWQGRTYDSLSTIAPAGSVGREKHMRVSRPSRRRSPEQAGTGRASLACARREIGGPRTTRSPAPPRLVRRMGAGSKSVGPQASDQAVAPACAPGRWPLKARHEARCLQTPALRDLHAQVDRA
jgi:Protein of unknown function (DUF2924)